MDDISYSCVAFNLVACLTLLGHTGGNVSIHRIHVFWVIRCVCRGVYVPFYSYLRSGNHFIYIDIHPSDLLCEWNEVHTSAKVPFPPLQR